LPYVRTSLPEDDRQILRRRGIAVDWLLNSALSKPFVSTPHTFAATPMGT